MAKQYDVVVVGAGFAGMYMLYRLRQMGFTARVYEVAADVGGTWYWNRYPGARCDIQSLEYSYSFSQELEQQWDWSERYASQEEILRYAQHVCHRFGLREHIQFNTEVSAMIFDENTNQWNIQVTEQEGRLSDVTATYCILATGCLSVPNLPKVDGLDKFKGDVLHTGRWPHDPVDFSSKRVAVIGTGSSAIQSIPVIAEQAQHLTVFQRTPNFVVPSQNYPLSKQQLATLKQDYANLRAKAKLTRNGVASEVISYSALSISDAERVAHFEKYWQSGGLTLASAFPDLLTSTEANATAAKFVRDKIAHIVNDPETAKLLSPNSTFGCKRLCVDNGYFQVFNRPNVDLVDISQNGVGSIHGEGLDVNGQSFEVDVIVFATGFDAMTGAINKIEINGLENIRLSDKWRDGPLSYLGLMISGFPNLFTITGPGSPSVLSNVLGSIEYHVDWIANCLNYMHERKLSFIAASAEAENGWTDTVNKVVDKTLYRTCRSWYTGENIEGKPAVFMPFPGVPPYIKKCNLVAKQGYTGMHLK